MKSWMWVWGASLGALLPLSTWAAQSSANSNSHCAGMPAVQAQTLPGWCLGQVADVKAGLRMPRNLLWLGRSQGAAELLVVDMGGWEPKKGRLLLMSVSADATPPKFKELLTGLDRPHGLRKGPDGAIYLAEATQITRWVWAQGQLGESKVILSDLPAQGRHPLKELVFSADGDLYFNVGAGSDRCSGAGSQVLEPKEGRPQCSESQGAQPQGAVYVAKMKWPGAQVVSVAPYAWGLRNSMGLAAHPRGTVLQAENNIDAPQEDFPPEEINALKPGAHYGWPSCVGNKQPMPGVAASHCSQTQAPAALIPAHAAPLHMEFSASDFSSPAAAPQKRLGLLVSLHGYRSAGQRIIRYAVSEDGLPQGKPVELVSQWKVANDKKTDAPGAPVAWAEDDRGHLWIADDRNRMIVWLGRSENRP